MALDNLPPEAQKLLPGAIGSLGALIWIKGTWPRRIAMVGLGTAMSYYGSPHLATMFTMNEGTAGFFLGLFGMSIVDTTFRFWQETDIPRMAQEWVRARLGLQPMPPLPQEPPKGGDS